ncbi:MAG: WD40/YVTN/BNR-like repeat-containing protein, partial [Gemmataceae bacterium]
MFKIRCLLFVVIWLFSFQLLYPADGQELPALIKLSPGAGRWRAIGPSAMGGRIVRLAVHPQDPSHFYVASASGGVFKTTNRGATFEPIFDKAGALSIGDVCLAPSRPEVIWVGTGEHNARNSVSWGDGVYKSIDGGKSFQHMGLKQSFQLGRIAIHPKNPEIVFVGALGRLWGPN